MNKSRLSSIELLRIISIFFVLIGHVGLVLNMLPSSQEIISNPSESIFKLLVLSISVGGVDVFILISGWFGIHASKRGLAKYIYQVFFLLWLIMLFFGVIDRNAITTEKIKASLCIYNGYWFIMAYLGLYLISPILNEFVEKATKRQFQMVLIALYIFQCYFSWISSFVNYYNGYSITLFCILYLTSRYFRLYPIKTIARLSLIFYLGIIIFITVVTTLSLLFTGTAMRMLRYDNPLVIFDSLCLLSMFSRWNFKTLVVNRIAMSCFAVYIIHFNPFVFPCFKKGVRAISEATSGVMCVFCLFLYLCLVFLACLLIDQLRILTWNLILKTKGANKILN